MVLVYSRASISSAVYRGFTAISSGVCQVSESSPLPRKLRSASVRQASGVAASRL